MKCHFATFAEGVNKTEDGKTNIFAMFDKIRGDNYPAVYARAYLYARLEFAVAETGKTYDCIIRQIDPDGRTVETVSIPLDIPTIESGVSMGDIVATFQMLKFDRSGKYIFDISVQGKRLITFPMLIEDTKKEE